MRHGRIRGALLAGVILTVALAAPVGAITNGQPDDGEHPYVGQLFFYVPDEVGQPVRRSRVVVQLHGHPAEPDGRPDGRALHVRDGPRRRRHDR